jgi:hypothetical protein
VKHLLCTYAAIGAASLLVSAGGLRGAVLLQQQAGYLAFEAEDYSVLTSAAYEVITTTSGTVTLPANTNAQGGALYNHNAPTAYATYNLAFTTDGTYYLYSRYSMFNRTVSTPTDSYGNEDSFYTASAFNLATNTTLSSWDTQHLNTAGYSPATTPNEGQFFFWDEANASDVAGLPVPDARTFIIDGASEATPVEVTFSVRIREPGVALDRFAFVDSEQTLTGSNSTYLNGLQSAPEPSRALMLLAGLWAVAWRRRR